jgi:hypothetical protein
LKKKENKDDRYCTYNDDCVAFDYLGRLDLCFNQTSKRRKIRSKLTAL